LKKASGQLHAPAALPPGKKTRYPLDKGLGGPQIQAGRGGEEKFPSRAGSRTPGTPVVQSVASLCTTLTVEDI